MRPSARIIMVACLFAVLAPAPMPRAATPDPSHPGYCLIERDAHGRIKRSAKAIREFKRTTGYPRGRPGYVIDHVVPLKRGGCDVPANMQWQTIEDARTKDRWE